MTFKYGDDRDHEVQEQPELEDLEYMVFDGVAEATDGCTVEPDGECEHGHKSWLIALGYI